MTETDDWRRLVAELEDRVESLSVALAEVRGTLRSLSDAAAESEPAATIAPEYESPVSQLVSLMSAEPAPIAQVEPVVSSWEQEAVAYEASAGWAIEAPAAEARDVEPAPEAVEAPAAIDWASTPGAWSWETAALADSKEAEPPSGDSAPAEDEHDDVRRAVEALRAELESDSGKSRYGWYETPADVAEVESNEVAVDEPAVSSSENGSDELDEDSKREEVRRAVEMARAELMGVVSAPEDEEAPFADGKALAPGALSEQFRFEGPSVSVAQPTIVLEDPEGRVELVRIFETLSRVQCAEQAVLLNYQPHSVTVGIATRTLPEADALASAVKDVFGRPCQVKEDKSSNRLSVQIANQHEGWPKAS